MEDQFGDHYSGTLLLQMQWINGPAASASPGGLLEMQNFTPDTLNQSASSIIQAINGFSLSFIISSQVPRPVNLPFK